MKYIIAIQRKNGLEELCYIALTKSGANIMNDAFINTPLTAIPVGEWPGTKECKLRKKL